MQGKLWIDAQTFQILREEGEIVVQASSPLVMQKAVFEYEPSKFEIFVPKKIIFTDYDVKKGAGKNDLIPYKFAQVTFDYSNLRKPMWKLRFWTMTEINVLIGAQAARLP